MKIVSTAKDTELITLYSTQFGSCFRLHTLPSYWPSYYRVGRKDIAKVTWMLTGEYYRDFIDGDSNRQLLIVDLKDGTGIGIHRNTSAEILHDAAVVL